MKWALLAVVILGCVAGGAYATYTRNVSGDDNLMILEAIEALLDSEYSGTYAEDAAHTSADEGVFSLGVRNDVLESLGGADGDYAPLQVGAEGGLFVSGNQREDRTATSEDYGTPVFGIRSDTRESLVSTDHDYTLMQMTSQGDMRTRDDDANTTLTAAAADLNELTAAPVEKTPTGLDAVIVGTPGTPLVLASDGTFFTYAILQAGRATAANASSISIIINLVDGYDDQIATQLAPGDTMTLIPPAGTKWDLNDWHIDGVNTLDGVRITYVAP